MHKEWKWIEEIHDTFDFIDILPVQPGVLENSKRACISNIQGPCSVVLQISVKNCGKYYVYELVPPSSFDTAYCFGENIYIVLILKWYISRSFLSDFICKNLDFFHFCKLHVWCERGNRNYNMIHKNSFFCRKCSLIYLCYHTIHWFFLTRNSKQ